MEFTIDNKLFKYDYNPQKKEQKIKSYNKNYIATYSNDNIKEELDNIIHKNDFVIIDKKVKKIYNLSFDINNYEIEATENNKNISTVLKIVDILNVVKLNKGNKIIVIGGGITQDIGGFVSCIYKRGIDWIYIPTTFLSMTDSCIGGKVGINHTYKNILGLFTAPNRVIINCNFLDTQTDEEKLSGIGEAIKLCLVGGKHSFDLMEKYFKDKNYQEIIKLSSEIKKSIIEEDEFDVKERRSLNYGHTFGHALEAETQFKIPHGIGVMIGMLLINELFDIKELKYINNFLKEVINPKYFAYKIDPKKVFTAIQNDKKNKGDDICFVVLKNYGITEIIYCDKNLIRDKVLKLIDDYFN